MYTSLGIYNILGVYVYIYKYNLTLIFALFINFDPAQFHDQ